ncbi:MAG TPA: DinB family protein [bacterium]|jgi:uncharacterized damage-inducible protein DinB
MTSQNLLNQFRFNQMILVRTLADISQEDSLCPPAAQGNCINYLLGHLIATRSFLLRDLGAAPVWGEGLAVYDRNPKDFPAGAKPLSELNGLLQESLETVTATLHSFEPRLGESAKQFPHLPEGGTFTDRIGSFICHEAYHVGQIGLARRALGKPGLF